jgi:hypothetical protein
MASSPVSSRRAHRARNFAAAAGIPRVSPQARAARIRLHGGLLLLCSIWPLVPFVPPSSPREAYFCRSAFALPASKAGRGGGIRTPTLGFGDRWSTVEPTPLYPENTRSGFEGFTRLSRVYPSYPPFKAKGAFRTLRPNPVFPDPSTPISSAPQGKPTVYR